MFVKSLRLRGFKSFAERTDVQFGQGITCVVGPNGSGKSNVVDALAWVMGVQGPRQIRGGRMEDVIFSGSPKRPALGRTHVELTLDNTDGAIPIGRPEIAIGRLLLRSGESRYTLCGQDCRLLDIVELLSDAGVGRQMHNIVSQGHIDEILMSSAEDRRVTIEEAAGVLKHRKRRERSLRRLESVEADLVRLEDVHNELRRRLRPLERQVKGAQRARDLTDLVRKLTLWRLGEEIRSRRKDEHRTATRLAELVGTLDDLGSQTEMLASELTAGEAMLQDSSDAVEASRTLRERLDRVFARLHSVTQVSVERRRAGERRLLELEAESDGTDPQAAGEQLREALERFDHEADSLGEEALSLGVELNAHAAAVTDLDAAWRASGLAGDERRAALNAQLTTVSGAVTRAEGELAALSDRLCALQERLGVLDEGLCEATTALAALDAPDAPPKLLRARLERVVDLRSRAELDGRRLAAQQRRLASEAAALGARAEALSADTARSRGATKAYEAVVESLGHFPRIRDLIRVERGAWRAVAAALDGTLDAVLLPKKSAAAALDCVKATDDGVLALVTTDSPIPDTEDPRKMADRLGVVAVIELVRPEPGPYRSAMAVFLRRHCARALLTRDGAHALVLSQQYPDLTFVTADGDRFSGGLLVVRSGNGKQAFEPVLAAADAEFRAAAVGRQAAQIGQRHDARMEEVARFSQSEKLLRGRLDESEATLASLTEARRRMERERGGVMREAEHVSARRRRLMASLTDERCRRDELQAQLDDTAMACPTDEERERLERRRSELDEKGKRLREDSLRIEADRARIAERRRATRDRIAQLEDETRLTLERRSWASAEKARWREVLHHLERLDVLTSAATAETKRRRDHVAKDHDRLAEARSKIQSRLGAVRTELTRKTQRRDEVARMHRDAELANTEARLRLEAAGEAPGRDLGASVEAALSAALPADVDPDGAEAHIETIQRQLRRIGPINPLAIEEHRELTSRNELLESELADVMAAKRDIANVVRQVDREIAEVLRLAYDDIGGHFADLFALLFPGGDGRLTLTDPEDLLETGIEIEARPSGKSLKRLSLLSGGERSLAALAFLFAVFRARPSPFYVLDEVEAALDDINLHRFCNLLHEFRRDSQVIVVTHQKRTMETADVLHGVSLHDDGTSSLLTQRMVDLDLVDEEFALRS